MKQLKGYKNLYQQYKKCRNKFMIPFFVCLVIPFLSPVPFFIFDTVPLGVLLVMLGMIFPAILFGVLWLCTGIRTKKHLKAFMPQQLDRIDREFPSKTMCEGLAVTGEAVIGTKLGLELVPMSSVLWVYRNVTVTKLNGVIPVHKDTALVFAGRDRKKYAFKIKNKGNAFEFIQSELLKYRLDVVFGFERGMDDIYKNDLNRLIAFSQECAEKRRQDMAVNGEA